MEIVWLGERGVSVRGKSATVVMDPSSGAAGADVVTHSRPVPGQGPCVRVGRGRVLSGPGEFDVAGTSLVGTQVPGGTVFTALVDDLAVTHLGVLGEAAGPADLEALDRVDVLLVPTGAGALTPARAAELIGRLDARVVVPLPQDGDASALEALCRQLGASRPDPRARLSLTAENLPESRQVVLLTAEGRRRGARAA